MSMKLFILLVLGLTVKNIKASSSTDTGLSELQTNCGRKVVSSDLDENARAVIKAAIESNGGTIKATFRVSIGELSADMRIDMAGEVGRASAHAGARVPHAQVGPFMMTRVVKGEERMVPFTPSFGAIELTSSMVLETISADGQQVQIVQGSALYQAIATTISKAAAGQKWAPMLFREAGMKPVIVFLGFASGIC